MQRCHNNFLVKLHSLKLQWGSGAQVISSPWGVAKQKIIEKHCSLLKRITHDAAIPFSFISIHFFIHFLGFIWVLKASLLPVIILCFHLSFPLVRHISTSVESQFFSPSCIRASALFFYLYFFRWGWGASKPYIPREGMRLDV